MNAMPEFTDAHAELLSRFLAAPERPEGTFRYEEVAGFLFAVASIPELIPPSEWLPFLFDDQDPNYADPSEAESCVAALMALYNRIVGEVKERRPALPPLCAPAADPMANFGPEGALGRWATGFGAGYDWLEEAWPEELDEEADDYLGVALVTLTFFESRELAQRYVDEMGGEPRSLEEWAADMAGMIPEAMGGYVELAAAVMEEEVQEPVRVEKIGRNDLCPCGSGMKYKKCCGKEA